MPLGLQTITAWQGRQKLRPERAEPLRYGVEAPQPGMALEAGQEDQEAERG